MSAGTGSRAGRASFSGEGGTESQARRASLVGDARKGVREKMVNTGWYHSHTAVKARQFLRGKPFGLMMIAALFVALFLPDIMTIAGNNNNTAPDVILTIVMVMFAVEFLGLSATDPSYLFGFFFMMDIIGTFSMVFDISFMLGQDATKPQYASGSDAKKNLMLLRATRAAKLGARAGRLSRVLKILRFLPFMRANLDQSDVAMARIISNQLSNLLATRVACLTIILVVILPIFGIVTFPEDDFSMRTWVMRLSEISYDLDNANKGGDVFAAGHARESFEKEIQEFAEFFEPLAYGPFKACRGHPITGDEGETTFKCTEEIKFDTTFEVPPRGVSQLILHTDNFMGAFNMYATNQLEAILGLVLICVVILVLTFAGLALSNVVNDLAVKPMERMLATVKNIATTIFKFTAVQTEEADEDAEEFDDIEQSTEMQLLEKIVHKLTTLAELSTKKQPDFDKENMGAEDLGVLNMMGGMEDEKQHDGNEFAMANGKTSGVSAVMKMEELGVTNDQWQSWEFNPTLLTKAQQGALSTWAIFNQQGCARWSRENISETKTQKFVEQVQNTYLANPYHNFSHALDVIHGVARNLKLSHAESYLTEVEQFAALVGALAHDIAHPGVNNPFLIESSHELALRYNDKSPLENMHCAKLYTLCATPETNIFASLTKELFREIRKHCIEMILHTDMVTHFAMVKDLTMLYQMNSDMFDAADVDEMVTSGQMPSAEQELFRQNDNKKLVMNLVLHSADVSNPCKNWDICELWAYFVLDEFFAQGDQEKTMGLPVQMLNDRDKVNKPNSQIGFIEFLVSPLINAQVRLFPGLYEFGDNLAFNLERWMHVWINDSHPQDEEKGKVKARVEKVQNAMEMAKARQTAPSK